MELVDKEAVKTALTFSEKLSNFEISDLRKVFDVIDNITEASISDMEDFKNMLKDIEDVSTSTSLKSSDGLCCYGVTNKTAADVKNEIIDIIKKYATKD